MHRLTAVLAALLLAAAFPGAARAQDIPQWRPPTTEMPAMPSLAELQGDWLGAFGTWFRNTERVSGVAPQALRASGSARAGTSQTQVARFMQGPRPVAVWTDRNGDGRADMIELYRDGARIIQVIDADYNGQANVMRIYDRGGALLREERL